VRDRGELNLHTGRARVSFPLTNPTGSRKTYRLVTKMTQFWIVAGQYRPQRSLKRTAGNQNQLGPKRPLLTSLTPIFLRKAVGNSAPIIAKMRSLPTSIGPSGVACAAIDPAPGVLTGSSTTAPGLICLSAVAG
jgi:hypothetical protein